jgi:hypothetical protein
MVAEEMPYDYSEDEEDSPVFMDCSCALTAEANSCVARKIKKLLGEGKSREQAVAIAVSMCEGEQGALYETAKEKQRAKFINPDGTFKKVDGSKFKGCVDYQMKVEGLAEEDAEELCAYIGRKAGKIKKSAGEKLADRPSLPGGEYEAIQNPDGSWNILDVPIFAEHKVQTPDGKIHIGKDWMLAALESAKNREADDRYLPPLHIHHHGTGRDTKLAGFFRLKDVQETMYQGKEIWATFADLVSVPDKIYREIKRGRLPYRSVEIHRVSTPSIDSLAIMPDVVPFFRLPMLTVGEEKPIELAQKLMSVAAPALAYRARGNGYSILSDMGGPPMASEKDRAEVQLAAWKDDEGEGSKIEINVEEEEEEKISESLRSKISKSLRELLSLMEEEVEEDQEEEQEVKEEAPAPVDMASAPEMAAASDGGVKMMAELDAVKRDLRQIKSDRDIETTVASTFGELEKRGLADEPIKVRLTSIAQKDGLVAMRAYADALREFPVDPPSRWTGDFATIANDSDVAKYSEFGPETSEKAATYAKEFDELQDRGLNLTFSRADHIASCLGADGFQATNSNGRF